MPYGTLKKAPSKPVKGREIHIPGTVSFTRTKKKKLVVTKAEAKAQLRGRTYAAKAAGANSAGLPKLGKKGKSAMVVTFDEEKRRDFVTGFHKRKEERRLKAKVEIKIKANKERLEKRARNRKALVARREELDAIEAIYMENSTAEPTTTTSDMVDPISGADVVVKVTY